MDITLLIIFTLYILFTSIYIIKRNLLFGIIYIFLYIYSIFAQIGYCFFPELSQIINAYFGKRYFYFFYFFNFLSFATFHFLFIIFYDKAKKIRRYHVLFERRISLFILFIAFITFYYLYLIIYTILNYDDIKYQNASDPEFLSSASIYYKLFAIFFKSLVGYGIIFYIQLRMKTKFSKISFLSHSSLKFVNILNGILLFTISSKIGSRTDVLAFVIGLIIFEILIGLNKKKITILASVFIFISIFLLYLEKSRLGESTSDLDVSLSQKILFKDYFAPAHLLYTSMYYNYINPLFVLKSNFANSLILLNVDYLQMPITEIIAPGVANRSQGFAFYLFTEGYIFMGFFGFLYNALMLFCGLLTWFVIYNSSFKTYRIMILTLMCTQVANLARSQSSYFYKDILVIFIPIFLFIYLSSGLRPKFFAK